MDRTLLSFLSLSLSLSDLGKNLVLGRPEAWAPWDLFPRLLAPTRLGKSCSTNRQPHQALEPRAGRKRESPRQSPQPATRGAEAALRPPSPVPALVSSLVLGGRLRAQGIQRTTQQILQNTGLAWGCGSFPLPALGSAGFPRLFGHCWPQGRVRGAPFLFQRSAPFVGRPCASPISWSLKSRESVWNTSLLDPAALRLARRLVLPPGSVSSEQTAPRWRIRP